MIDIEDLEKKYLIALQTLQDCMNEYGLSEHQMDYLRQIRAENHVPRIGYFLRELTHCATRYRISS